MLVLKSNKIFLFFLLLGVACSMLKILCIVNHVFICVQFIGIVFVRSLKIIGYP